MIVDFSTKTMESPRINTKLLKRYILNSANDARLLIAERELNKFSDNAESILIIGKGNNRINDILSQLKILFDNIDSTKVHKVLYCIFCNLFAPNELHIRDVSAISKFFNCLTEATPVFGLYQNEKLDDDVELIVIFE